MEQMNFHKQKLYSLIGAGIALISLLLPWITVKGFGSSENGFHGWGLLSLLGIAGVVGATFLDTNKMKPFEGQFKQLTLGGFGLITAGAAFYLLRILFGSRSVIGIKVKFSDFANPGLGLFICLLAGIAGLAFLMGYINFNMQKSDSSNATTTTGITKITTTTPTDTEVRS